MAPWLPFLLLPLYFAGLVGAVVWLAPRTTREDGTAVADVPPTPQNAPRPPADPVPLMARRERPKRGTTIGVILFALYWVGMITAAWWQTRHGRA
ncbi:MAG: hypothetical protein H0X24_22300 [Ktedonobacterales bacterium]|nr:hypothetical protein [Ktedonobacterales bacterium]